MSKERIADVRTFDNSVRAIDDSDKRVIQGTAIVFNQRSQYMGFYEEIKPEAVRNLDWTQCLLLYNHEYGNILARANAENLQIETRDEGVYFKAQLPNTTLARDVYEDVCAGNVQGCSFGFKIAEDGDEWTETEDGEPLHIIREIESVSELSLTPIPAYTQTSASVVRSLKQFKEAKQMDEEKKKPVEDVKPKPEMKPEEKPEGQPEIKPQIDDEMLHKLKMLSDLVDGFSAMKDKPKEKEVPVERSAEPQKEDEPKADPKESSDESVIEAEKKEGGQKMAQVLKEQDKDKKPVEVRNFENWLKGNTRDLTEGFKENPDGKVVIPEQILSMYKMPNDPNNLAQYINRVNVSAPSGRIPVLAKANATLATAEELQANPQIANAVINKVDYALSTYRGQLPISNEMIQDYPSITSLLSEYVQYVKASTEQKKIGAVLQTAPAKSATSLDDIKGLYNDLVNYGADRMFIVTASMYTELDTMKNQIGDYMLNHDVTSATGKSLLGAPIVVVPDTILGSAGDKKMFIGSAKAFVTETIKGDVSVNWTENEYFEQVLGVAVRLDFKAVDTEAGYFVTYTAASKA